MNFIEIIFTYYKYLLILEKNKEAFQLESTLLEIG